MILMLKLTEIQPGPWAPLLDVPIGFFVVIFGILLLYVTAVFFCLVTLSETVVLWSLKWGSLGYSLLDSLLMNSASTLLGFLFACWVMFKWQIEIALTLRAQLIFWPLSVLIEGGVLTLLKRHPARQTWRTCIAANAVSYLLLIALATLWKPGLLRL